jgi:hypothetical protein
MNIRIYLILPLIMFCVFFKNVHTMEQELGPATAAAISVAPHAPIAAAASNQREQNRILLDKKNRQPAAFPAAARAPTTHTIKIVSSQGENNPVFEIRPEAIQYSKVLQSMLDVLDSIAASPYPEDKKLPIFKDIYREPISFDFSNHEIKFVADVLNFLSNEQDHRIVRNFINDADQTLSFDQALRTIYFFDIPIAFNALISMRAPHLPRSQAAEIIYNQMLTSIFTLAKPSTVGDFGAASQIGDTDLWEFFGSILYPGCLQYPEIAHMIDFITAERGGRFTRGVRTLGRKISSVLDKTYQGPIEQKTIEHIVLSTYMLQNPELYSHPLETTKSKDRIVDADNSIVVAKAYNHEDLWATGNDDGTFSLRKRSDKSIIRRITGHADIVTVLTFSRDNKIIASGSRDHTLRLWRVADGLLIKTFADIPGIIYSISFCQLDKSIAIGLDNGILQIRSVADGRILKVFIGLPHSVRAISFNKFNNLIVSGLDNGVIQLWRIADNSLIKTIIGHKGNIWFIGFADATIYSLTTDGTRQIWGYKSLREALMAPIIQEPRS